MIRLIARAFRTGTTGPGQPALDAAEVLLIALRTTGGAHQIVWRKEKRSACIDASAPRSPWSGDLGPLKKPGGDLLERSWERVELFNRVGAPTLDADEDLAELMRATPRLSFDTVAEASPHVLTKWSWRQNEAGKAAPYERRAKNKSVLYAKDLSCLFVEESTRGGRTHQFLIANVRIRNLLSRTGSDLDTMTWQFVVHLGSEGEIDGSTIWEDSGDQADLKLRDVLCCTARESGSDGYSSFEHVDFNGLARPFPLHKLTRSRSEQDPKPDKNMDALMFTLGKGRDARSPWMRALRPDDLEKFPLNFDTASPDSQRGGLSFVADDRGPASLRFYARDARPGEQAEGTFVIDRQKPFFVQDQILGDARDGSTYQPRGADRRAYVEWRLFAVDQAVKPVKWWTDEILTPGLRGLRSVRDGVPQTFAPRIAGAPFTGAWMAAVAVRDHVSNQARYTDKSSSLIASFEVTPAMYQPARQEDGEPHLVALAGLTSERGEAVTGRAVFCHPARLAAAGSDHWMFSRPLFAIDAPTITFGLRLLPPANRSPSMRIGALMLAVDEVGEAGEPVEPDAAKWFGWRIACSLRDEAAAVGEPSFSHPTFRIETRLPVVVRTGGIDGTQRDTTAEVDRELGDIEPFSGRELDVGFAVEEPLAIDLDASAWEPLLLRADEAVADGRSHNLRLKLFVRGPQGTGASVRNVMILDRTPFGVYLARTPTLSGLADAESGEVAVWDAAGEGGAHWRLAELPEGVEIFLPPQGIGEAMEKTNLSGDPADPGDDAVIDFRFTPHARLQIDPSFQDQRYGETPWNVRRLFGYAEQRSPGSRLTGFDVELLYGLTGQARELTDVMIAEVESRLGRPAGRQNAELPWRPDGDQSAKWRAFRQAWGQTRELLATRLGVLETYDLRGRELVIEEGLTWYQRGWSPAPRAAKDAQKGPALAFPLANYTTIKQERPGLANALFDADGLAGGWTWGFTSLNILEAVLRDPNSTSGFLSGLKFSALGGWGRQKVSFDEDRTSVHADTAMGRTHFYSLERICIGSA